MPAATAIGSRTSWDASWASTSPEPTRPHHRNATADLVRGGLDRAGGCRPSDDSWATGHSSRRRRTATAPVPLRPRSRHVPTRGDPERPRRAPRAARLLRNARKCALGDALRRPPRARHVGAERSDDRGSRRATDSRESTRSRSTRRRASPSRALFERSWLPIPTSSPWASLVDDETARAAVLGASRHRWCWRRSSRPSASAGLRRLCELGGDPALVSAASTGVVAQQIVRKTCLACRETYYATVDELSELGLPPEDSGRRLLGRGRGCDECGDSGYQGQTSLIEVLPLTDEVRALVADGASVGRDRMRSRGGRHANASRAGDRPLPGGRDHDGRAASRRRPTAPAMAVMSASSSLGVVASSSRAGRGRNDRASLMCGVASLRFPWLTRARASA